MLRFQVFAPKSQEESPFQSWPSVMIELIMSKIDRKGRIIMSPELESDEVIDEYINLMQSELEVARREAKKALRQLRRSAR